MRILITNYTFNAAAKTVTFTDYGTIVSEKVLSIVNKTRGVVYHDPEDSTKLGTVATNVFTFAGTVSTTGHANGDKLEIWYENIADSPNVPISAASLPLPANAAQENSGHLEYQSGRLDAMIVLDTTRNATLVQIEAKDFATDARLTQVRDLLDVVDDWDETDRAKVNTIPGQVGVAAGAGANSANTQRVTIATDDSIHSKLPAALGAGGGLKVDGSGTALPVSGTVSVSGVATATKQDEQSTLVGAVNETAPASDTASSGLNGRLQRIAQRLSSLIALLPTSLTGSGNLRTAIGEALPAGANRIGSVRLVDSSDGDLTSTKGTQTSRSLVTQNVKDTGRVSMVFYAAGAASGTTGTETAITLTKSAGTAATSSAASFVVTSGKKFRIQSIVLGCRGNATATAQVTTFSIRINTAGAVTTGSTPILLQQRVGTVATASQHILASVAIPDGFEIDGDGTLQFGITANSVFVTNAPTWDVTIIGYEY